MQSYDASAAAFFDISCKRFSQRPCHDKQQGALNEQTNEGVYVGC